MYNFRKKHLCDILYTLVVFSLILLIMHAKTYKRFSDDGVVTKESIRNRYKQNTPIMDVGRELDTSMDCFKVLEEALPDISTVQLDWKKSIFFLEVSCRSSQKGRIAISPRHACAIESAAFTNPNSEIYVLYASSGVIKDEGTLSDYLLHLLLEYKNIKFLHFEINSLVNGSIVESLYKENKVQTSAFPLVANSDICRMLTMQKYGGTYLDLDVIVLKNLDTLPVNCVGIESKNDANGDVMRIADDSIGKNFVNLYLNHIKNHFDGSQWQSTGPAVVTKIVKEVCHTKDASVLPQSDCEGFQVMPPDIFYPVKWNEWKQYFEEPKSDNLLNHILNNSYIVHIWNKNSANFEAVKVPNSIYNTLAQQFCPIVFNEAGKYF